MNSIILCLYLSYNFDFKNSDLEKDIKNKFKIESIHNDIYLDLKFSIVNYIL